MGNLHPMLILVDDRTERTVDDRAAPLGHAVIAALEADPIHVRVLYCIPNHNNATFLPELLASIESDAAIGSIDASILLVNDGCTDASATVAREYQALGSLPPHVRETPIARGEGAARATVLDHARSFEDADYLRAVDSDDLLPPGSTWSMILAARALGLSAVSGEFRLFGSDGVVRDMLPVAHDEIMAMMRRTNPFRTACALFDARQARMHNLTVDPRWKRCADYALLIDLARYGRLGNLAEPVLLYRQHAGSITGQARQRVSAAFLRIVAANWRNPVLPRVTGRDLLALARLAILVATPPTLLPRLVAVKQRLFG